eukprot:11286296-Karenia_brevis.AAC.1
MATTKTGMLRVADIGRYFRSLTDAIGGWVSIFNACPLETTTFWRCAHCRARGRPLPRGSGCICASWFRRGHR